MRTGVALGSNLGDRLGNLRAARKTILDLSNVKPPILSSAIYETEPVYCEPGAGKFLNAVVEFISRAIDIDLLYCGDCSIEDERLQLPHPRIHLRKFVLQPLTDVRADLVLPNQRKTIRELLAESKEAGEVIRVADDW
ncbi:MAG: hypothetical protein DMF00_17035 [Verrucomicrobia bacterium]|nr:MAG: hypothetical protein DMF00_17035 [Verrucomicrobiota bacterium]